MGSEGTLGVITGAVVKLYERPAARATAWVGAYGLDHLVALLARLRTACGERLAAFEMMSHESLELVLAHTPGLRAPLEGRHACHALVELADTHDFGLGALLESTLGRALADGRIDGAAVCTSDAQRANVWKIREGISQAQVRAGRAIKHLSLIHI